jgi:gliding motility-associated-like protein
VHAQCGSAAISLTGGTCVGEVLTAYSNSTGATVVWKLNGTKTVATQTTSIPINGTTIAGGNGNGSAANQFNNPNRIFIDGAGNLYVPDMTNSRIQKWVPGATSGVTVAGGNGTGPAANQFNRPTSVYVDSKGNVYVTDQNNNRLQKWAPGATTGVTVASNLSTPTGVFMDAQENLYITEQNNSLVSKWAPGAARGVTVAGGRGYGSAASQFSTPTGIYIDAAGNLYVCDTDNNRVQKWAPGASTGTTVAGGNGYGSRANQLANPLGVYVDAGGNVYVSDYGNYRVQRWAPGATAGVTVAGGNGSGAGSNQLNTPAGISMDAACNLYIADFFNHRIQKFATAASNTYTTLEPGNYTATLTTPGGVTTVSNSITVSATQAPTISIRADQAALCPGTTVTFTASATGGGAAPVYQWKKNGVPVGSNTDRYVDDAIKDGDAISCTLTSNAPCLVHPTAESNNLTMRVQQTHQRVNLGPDLRLCPGASVTLDAGASYASYLWQDGSWASSLTVGAPGTYRVAVRDACGGTSSDTVVVVLHPQPQNFLAAEASFCTDASLELKPSSPYPSRLWSTGDTTSSIVVRTPGTYWLEVTDHNGCTGKQTVLVSQSPCARRFYVPTSFTPNGDGKNERLKPIVLDRLQHLKFIVYNRWGVPVYTTTQQGEGWDGKIGGKLQDTGLFVWICTYQIAGEPLRTERGTVTLLK